jgi:serine/threonine protein kinase
MLHGPQLLLTVCHPELVLFLGACRDRMPPFFFTELMACDDLERFYAPRRVQEGRPPRPSWPTVMNWAHPFARALGFLHSFSQPIIHCDLKTLNLLLDKSQDLKVGLEL